MGGSLSYCRGLVSHASGEGTCSLDMHVEKERKDVGAWLEGREKICKWGRGQAKDADMTCMHGF